jgi:hypothetical protein
MDKKKNKDQMDNAGMKKKVVEFLLSLLISWGKTMKNSSI